MAIIGTFTKTEDKCYSGTIKTLALNTRAKMIPAPVKSEKGPDFRVFAGAVEIGAAWAKKSAEDRSYLTVKLDDPSLPAPIFATLVQVEGEEIFTLIWNRSNGNA